MDQRICSNPECRKIYNVMDKDADLDTCGFSCWEKIHCKTPPEIHFEKLEIA